MSSIYVILNQDNKRQRNQLLEIKEKQQNWALMIDREAFKKHQIAIKPINHKGSNAKIFLGKFPKKNIRVLQSIKNLVLAS